MESNLAIPLAHGRDSNVVDLRLMALVTAAGDGHFVLAGQVGELFVANEIPADFVDDSAAVVDLIRVDAGDGATRNVSSDVPAGADGCEADRVHLCDTSGIVST